MTARLWHLTRTEARAHRGALCLWLAVLAWVTAGSITNTLFLKNFTWHDQEQIEGSFLDSLLIWNLNNIASVGSWLWLGAGLLSAWIWLADPLQSSSSFWVTRPARVPELMTARALLCLAVFGLLPAVLAACDCFAGGFPLHDTGLSMISTWLVKAGLVPLGFLAGAFWPAPGRRWLALLPALAWWLALIAWRSVKASDADFQDHSWTFTLLWAAVPFALLALLKFRRLLIPQYALAVLAFAVVWSAGSLKQHSEKPTLQSAEGAGFPQLRVSALPLRFDLSASSSAKQWLVIRLKPTVSGLPPDVAAEVTAWQPIITPGSKKPWSWPQWPQHVMVMDTFYRALAHSMGLAPGNFPAAWRSEEGPISLMSFSFPAATFNAWKEDQKVQITGKVRLRLFRLHQDWQGIYHKSQSEGPGGLRLHDTTALIRGRGEVLWLRPWLAQNVQAEDQTSRGMLFNPLRSFWFVPFQPPQRLPDGTFTKQITRAPAFWATGEYEGPGSTLQIKDLAPEFHEIVQQYDGLDGLPAALIGASEIAELEVPFEPLTLTKQQILDTRKILPARP